jgi:serine/threonine-protein kinase
VFIMLTALKPGDKLLHYRLIGNIGEGGMGVVYEAEDLRLGRTVALKVLQPSISENPEARSRFLREARAASALDHPNLCTIYTVEELPDASLLLVMACYRGQTVADLVMKHGALDPVRIRDIGRQTAAGLHAAHMAGIVHRDIKPGNIFVLHSGTVKVLDFGLSHVASQQQLTAPHQVMGTLAYMPPEQLAGESVDHRADIWALGAVLYEMSAGHPPFQHASTAATMLAISEGRYIALHKVRPGMPKSIITAVERALRREPHERHSSAADLLKLLEEDMHDPLPTGTAYPAVAPTVMVLPEDAETGFPATEIGLCVVEGPVYGSSGDSAAKSNRNANGHVSIAVLPLRNISSDPENEYFSDGLTDELISSLGTLPGLRVVSRTSAFSFKGKMQNIREIGEALDVEVILEGSVRRSGARVRITTQLTQVRQGFHLWSARFDREITDVFELQDELATAVVSALREKLAVNLNTANLQARSPMQADAYESYLKGRYHWNRRTPEDLHLAGRYFERALKLDPKSGAAFAGMADFYCLQGIFGTLPAHEAFSLARSSSLQAIALDPALPEAHLAMASVLHFYDWDWEGARHHLVRALELQPQRGDSYYMYAAHLMTQGLLEEALDQARTGLHYDPLSTPLLGAEATLRAYLGDCDSSILLARSALQEAPHYVELYYALGMAQMLSGRPDEAVQTFEHGIEHSHMPILKGWLAEACVQSGDRERAQAILEQMIDLAARGNPMPLPISIAAAALGDIDLALTWLERSATQRDLLVAYIAVFPSLSKLHGEPRYRQLLERMRLKHPSTQRRRHVAR